MTAVKDRLWTPEFWTPGKKRFYEGKITLQLFDAKTGKKQAEEVSHNYATDALISILKANARGYLRGILASPGVTNNDPGTVGTLDTFVLTDATSAEDQTNDRFIRGLPIAYSQINTYTGSDTWRGSLNLTESLISGTANKFVIDWPTNAGNGTIQSVYACNWFNDSHYFYSPTYFFNECWNRNAPAAPTDTGYGRSWTDSMTGLSGGNQRGMWLDPDGASYWTLYIVGTTAWTLVKRTLGTGAQVSTITLTVPGGVTACGFTNDGSGAVGNWWVMCTNGTLYKYPAAGGASTANYPNVSASSNDYGQIVAGGGYIYLQSGRLGNGSGPNQNLYQINPTTGGLVTTITEQYGMEDSTSGNWDQSMFFPDSIREQAAIGYLVDATNGDNLWAMSRNYISTETHMFRFKVGSGARIGNFSPLTAGSSTSPTNSLTNSIIGGITFPANAGYIVNTGGSAPVNYQYQSSRQFLARSLLPSAVTKANTQTMKLTYEFDYS